MEEAQMREAIDLVGKFAVDKLDSEWIKSVIDADFTDVDDLPSNFEDFHCSTNFPGLFDAVVGSCRQWIDSLPVVNENSEKRLSVSSTTGSPHAMRRSTSSFRNTSATSEVDLHTSFWIALSENVNIKGLKALLFYYIHRAQRYDAREYERELGIKASSVYFLLLCVPGSNAFRVFHPVLYLKTIEILRLTVKLSVAASSSGKKGRKGSSRKSHDDLFFDDDDDAVMTMLTPVETSKLVRSLNVLLNDFLRLSKRFSFKHLSECLDETISILIDVSRCETRDAQGIFLGRHGPSTVTALAYNAYVALQSMCNPIHGKINRIVILIMKHIMNNILMISRGSSDLSPRALGVVRDHSQIFVKYVLTQVKDDAYEGVYILIQHICIRVPDKAEYRQKTAQSVVEILRYLPIQLYTRLVKWFFKFSHNEKAGHRLFMLEVISKMLDEKERVVEDEESHPKPSPSSKENRPSSRGSSVSSSDSEDSDNNDSDDEAKEGTENNFLNVNVDQPTEVPDGRNILSHKFLLSIIFSRCRDSGATVRGKALALLAECTYSKNPTIMMAMKQIFFRNRPSVVTTPHVPNNNSNVESPLDEGEEDLDLPNAAMVVSMLHRRALDDKVIVRKSALQVLENLMKLDNEMLNDKNLEVLMEHCRDPALLVRKQMIVALSGLVESYPESESVVTNWIKGVFPLILDPEIKVQEKVTEYIDQLLFRRLVPYIHPLKGTPDHKLPWLILSTITKLSFHKFFNKALMMWSKADFNRPQIVKVVRSYVGSEYNEEMWTLLAGLSNYIAVTDASFVVDYFEEQCQSGSEVGSYTLQQVLKVLSNSIKHIPGNRGEALHERLLHPVQSFNVGAQLISSLMDTLTLLTYSMHGDEEKGLKALEKWVGPIMRSCDDYLKGVLFERSIPVTVDREEKFFRHIYTLGEASMLCPHKVNRRMFLMVQSIIFHQPKRDSLRPSAIRYKPSTRVRSVAVVTLGKMCLQHEEQAKRIIPALGRMLDTQICSALKVNIVFTLSDMCVRYATLVDPLMPQVTACLRDPDIEVRRTTLTLLINLLQEDYLKLKGSFFYRILQCLTDDHEEVRSTVLFYITERLLKRFPKILCQHFLECIFHYNCYEEHESYNRFTQSSVEKELFSLAGKEHTQDRMMIYKFMLDQMPDDQRFTTTQRLCLDVLGGVVNGRIKLSPSSLPMLEDTLSVLRCDEIKLASLKSRPEDVDQPTDQAEQAAMAGMVIKKTIISQVIKRNVIENIVPILLAVKQKLEEHKSPLMKHLLLYLKDIMKDYKNEIKEILAGDKQLAREIEFDLKRIELEQKEKEALQKEAKENDNSLEQEEREDTSQESNITEEQTSKDISPEKGESESASGNEHDLNGQMNKKNCTPPVSYCQDNLSQDAAEDDIPVSKDTAKVSVAETHLTERGTQKTKGSVSSVTSKSNKNLDNKDSTVQKEVKDKVSDKKDETHVDIPAAKIDIAGKGTRKTRGSHASKASDSDGELRNKDKTRGPQVSKASESDKELSNKDKTRGSQASKASDGDKALTNKDKSSSSQISKESDSDKKLNNKGKRRGSQVSKASDSDEDLSKKDKTRGSQASKASDGDKELTNKDKKRGSQVCKASDSDKELSNKDIGGSQAIKASGSDELGNKRKTRSYQASKASDGDKELTNKDKRRGSQVSKASNSDKEHSGKDKTRGSQASVPSNGVKELSNNDKRRGTQTSKAFNPEKEVSNKDKTGVSQGSIASESDKVHSNKDKRRGSQASKVSDGDKELSNKEKTRGSQANKASDTDKELGNKDKRSSQISKASDSDKELGNKEKTRGSQASKSSNSDKEIINKDKTRGSQACKASDSDKNSRNKGKTKGFQASKASDCDEELRNKGKTRGSQIIKASNSDMELSRATDSGKKLGNKDTNKKEESLVNIAVRTQRNRVSRASRASDSDKELSNEPCALQEQNKDVDKKKENCIDIAVRGTRKTKGFQVSRASDSNKELRNKDNTVLEPKDIDRGKKIEPCVNVPVRGTQKARGSQSTTVSEPDKKLKNKDSAVQKKKNVKGMNKKDESLVDISAVTRKTRHSSVSRASDSDQDSAFQEDENTKGMVKKNKIHIVVQGAKTDMASKGPQKTRGSLVGRALNSNKKLDSKDTAVQELNIKETLKKKESHVDPKPIVDSSSRTPKRKMPQEAREELSRAISTPHHKTDVHVISNVTFMDGSQDISAVTLDSTVTSQSKTGKKPRVDLHLQSSGSYDIESEFTRVCKSRKKSELNREANSKQAKQTPKRSSESFDIESEFTRVCKSRKKSDLDKEVKTKQAKQTPKRSSESFDIESEFTRVCKSRKKSDLDKEARTKQTKQTPKRSSESFDVESEFTVVRKSRKKIEFNKEAKTKQAKPTSKRSSGDLGKSRSRFTKKGKSVDSCVVKVKSSPQRSKTRTAKTNKGKRTRAMTSLSSDPNRAQPKHSRKQSRQKRST